MTTPNPPEQQREATRSTPEWKAIRALAIGFAGNGLDDREIIADMAYEAFRLASAVRAAMDEPQRAETGQAVSSRTPSPSLVHSGGDSYTATLTRLARELCEAVEKQVGNTSCCRPSRNTEEATARLRTHLSVDPPAQPQQRDEAGETCTLCRGTGKMPHYIDVQSLYEDPPASPSPATDAGWRSKCEVYCACDDTWWVQAPRSGEWAMLLTDGTWTTKAAHPRGYWPTESAARSALASAPPPPGAEPARSSVTEAKPCGDAIVEGVVTDLRARSRVGQAKYGVMLTRTDLSDAEWLDHLYTEMLDAVNYLAVIRRRRAESQIAAALAQPPNSGDAKK